MIVPHFFQSSEQTCGATCLRMLSAALGLSFDEATIVVKCGTTALGCTVQDLVQGAKALGLDAEMLPISGGAAALAALSSSWVPFIAMIDLASLHNTMPMFQWHFVVSLAIAQNEVIFHDPADGPDRRALLDDFLAAWGTAGYRGVRVWIP
ncbi:MAG TPA: cysteine peptidase family C39 domain-containing protein [Gemmataceae bacterium]|nr:cysteine peptidase family C39 domain-containing protein [Gemmataceae bacterium]